MKIGIDYISAVGGGGNSRYTKNLTKAMVHIDKSNTYYIYSYLHDFVRGKTIFLNKNKNVHIFAVNISSFGISILSSVSSLVNKIIFYLGVHFFNINIFHFTNPLNFMIGAKKSVVTIHDIAPLHNDSWVKKNTKIFFERNLKKILNKTDHIIAVSKYTKKDIIKNFNVDEKKITVVYEAVSDIFYPDIDRQYIKNEFGFNDYILYVGQLQPRKNIINMLLAYAKLSTSLKERYPIVLVGSARDPIYSKVIKKIIEKHHLIPYVKIIGYQKDNVVRKLYSCARVFIFPSLFEGFGLPVLESLQCGVPVITSKTTSLPEVAGDAGILVNPDDINEIAHAVEKILVNNIFYNTVKNRSLVQAKKFSWEKAATETSKVYESIYKSY